MVWQGCCACAKGPHGFRTSSWLLKRLAAGQKL